MAAWIKRWRWPLLALALLGLGLGFAFWPEATPVDTARVTHGAMSVGITDDGVTRAKDIYFVSAPVSGRLSRIELEVGDRVARGDVVATMTSRPAAPLDPRAQQELAAQAAIARSGETSAAASLAQAQRDLARVEALAAKGFVPKAQLEAARTRVSTSRAALLQARGETSRIASLRRPASGATGDSVIRLRAPASGAVLSVINESEGILPDGTPIMAIGDPARIEVVVDLVSREAVRAKPGDRVLITRWGGDQPLAGKVARIEPSGKLKVSALGIEEQRVNVIVAFDGPASQIARLGHGYQVDATIILWSRTDALRVPIGALSRGTDGTWQVVVVEGGRARTVPVRIGHINDEFAEVLGGLREGQTVILNPSRAVRDRKRVKGR
jgi:HlyD family secretion protein